MHTVNINQLTPFPHSLLTIPVHPAPKPLPKATGQEELESMRKCPKFPTCSAPICPLDPNWHLRDMKGSDPTCTWFREIAKAGPEAHCIPMTIREKVASALLVILPSLGLAPLRSALKRAAKSGSKRNPESYSRLSKEVEQ